MDTASWFLWRLGDSVFWIRRFVRRSNDLILKFVNSSNVFETVVIDRPEDLSEVCDIQYSLSDNMYVLIGPYCGSMFWFTSRSLFNVLHVIHRPDLTSDRLLLKNTITRCSNITAQYARSV